MAQQRKKPGRPSGSRNNSKTGSSRKTASTRKSRADSYERAEINSRVRDEIVAVLIIAAGVFLVVAFQTEAAGTFGNALSDFFKGCFGFAAYILPYYFIIYGIMLFTRQTIHVGMKSVVLLLVIFLMISLMNAGRFIVPADVRSDLGSVSAHYVSGMHLESGGVFGMMAGGGIVRLMGLPGLYIVTVVAVFICLVLLMNTPVSRFLEEARIRKERRAAAHEEKLREKERLKEERLRQMEMEMTLGSFDAKRPAQRDQVTGGQRRILDYISSESFRDDSDTNSVPEAGDASQYAEDEEVLDFTLGEDPPPKKKRGRKKKVQEAPADDRTGDISGTGDDIQTEMFPAEEDVRREPVIVGGYVPKKAEEKLTSSEAAKSMLREDDFNVTVSSAEEYVFPSVDLLNAKKSDSSGMDNENTLRAKAMKLEDTLHSFNIDAQVTNVTQGPAVTTI